MTLHYAFVFCILYIKAGISDMKTTHVKRFGLFVIIPVVLLAIIIICWRLHKCKLKSLFHYFFMEILYFQYSFSAYF